MTQSNPSVSNHAHTSPDYTDLKARYERLMEINRQLNSTLDLNALLNRIITAAIELTNTEAASILLVDPQTGELRFEAASDISSGTRDALVVPKEGSVAGWVVRHGEYVLVADVANDPRWFGGVQKSVKTQTQNMLAVPMQAHTEVIGALEAINKQNNAPFTDDDINTLMTLASQAAIAIQNARLFQQNDFIAELVHELRTPLAALKASTALLLRPTLPEEKRQEITLTMERETDRLSKLTTEFLDLARLESGRTRLEVAEFDIADLITECVEVVQHQASERGITFQLGITYQAVTGDRGKVKQVLLNLLTNAIKYNKAQGQIFITTEYQILDTTKVLTVAVRDTGRGISPENQQHMFERFYRVADTQGFTQGTGLGLVIAKRIIEAHGGTMWLESILNTGTTFYFTIPNTTSTIKTAVSPSY